MTETPKYSVIKKHNDIEPRHYSGYIQAHVNLPARDYRSAIEQGFNVLAGYIFGGNTARQSIEMTSPVQVSQSQKIAMTTPVTVSGDGQFSVAFIMPSQYNLETLPIPKDERIHFTQFPAHTMAAIRFSGYFNQKTIQQNQARLRQWLEAEGITTEGDFLVAGYNPPWVPGFLARNEVLIRVKPDSLAE
jgi:hypothetical protein